MLELAMRFQIPWIFKEAAAHMLGRSNRYYNQHLHFFTVEGLAELFRKKRAAFVAELKSAEGKLFQLKSISSNNMLIAKAFFRNWLADQLRANLGSELGAGYAAVYHRVNENMLTGDKSQRTAEVTNFLTTVQGKAPDTAQITKIEKELDVVVTAAATCVRDLVRSRTTAEYTASKLHRALTFMEIEDEELPWPTK